MLNNHNVISAYITQSIKLQDVELKHLELKKLTCKMFNSS